MYLHLVLRKTISKCTQRYGECSLCINASFYALEPFQYNHFACSASNQNDLSETTKHIKKSRMKAKVRLEKSNHLVS